MMIKPDVVIEKSVEILKTPLCDIWIEAPDGERVRFDILQNQQERHTVSLYNFYHQIREEIEVKNFFDCILRIDTNGLALRTDYFIVSSKLLVYRDRDERLFTYGLTESDMTLSVSFPDPNEDRKCGFLMRGVEYTEDDLKYYNIEHNSDGRFLLRLLDREKPYIYLSSAWIWGIEDIEENMPDYEETADVLTWCI